jgi:hypothetical protein
LFLGINILPGVSGEIFHLPFWLKIGTLEKLLKMFMSICLSKNIGEMVGQEVTVRGWVYRPGEYSENHFRACKLSQLAHKIVL